VDFDGTGQIVNSLRGLMKSISPGGINQETVDKLSNAVKNPISSIGSALTAGTDWISKNLNIGTLNKGIKPIKGGVGPVNVRIGNFFSSPLIIESVSCRYSKEQTANGPLYADFTVRFSTQSVVSRDDIGGLFKSASGRVRVRGN